MTRTRTMPAMLTLVGAALAASAQQDIDFTIAPKAPPAPAASSTSNVFLPSPEHNNVITITSDEDGKAYRVVIRGDTVTATKNGTPIEPSRVIHEPDRVIILHPDGKKEEKVFRVRAAPQPAGFRFRSGDDNLIYERAGASTPPPVMLGISLGDPSPALRHHLDLGDRPAILVERIADGLSADNAGVQLYDVIVSIDGSDNADGSVLRETLADKDPGDILELTIARGAARMDLKVELARYDPSALSSAMGNDPVRINRWITPSAPTAPTTPFVFNDRRGEMFERLREQLEGNRDIRRHLNTDQLDEINDALEEAFDKLDFDFDVDLNNAYGMLEFRHNGDDKKLVFPKRQVEILAERERELVHRQAERDARQAEEDASRAQADARQRDLESQLEALRAQIELLSQMLRESRD